MKRVQCVRVCVCVCVRVCVSMPAYPAPDTRPSHENRYNGDVTLVSQWCNSGVTRVSWRCYSGVTVASQCCSSVVEMPPAYSAPDTRAPHEIWYRLTVMVLHSNGYGVFR
jgi:hypothetical protein